MVKGVFLRVIFSVVNRHLRTSHMFLLLVVAGRITGPPGAQIYEVARTKHGVNTDTSENGENRNPPTGLYQQTWY